MAESVSRYNHTANYILSGSLSTSHVLKLMLCSAATFDATNTTLASVVKTESSGGGYPAGGLVLAGLSAAIVDVEDSALDAADTIFTPSGSSLSASYGILYDDTDVDKTPLLFLDFDRVVIAEDGVPFKVTWSELGILRLSWS